MSGGQLEGPELILVGGEEEEEVVVEVVGGQGACLEQHHVMSMLASWVRPKGMDVPNTEQGKEKAGSPPRFLLAAAVR